jgi:hypothetical protein
MIQLTRTETVFSGPALDLESLRSRFDREHCIQLPSLLEPGLLQFVQRKLGQVRFNRTIHEGVGVELLMADDLVLNLLFFLINNPKFLQIIKTITSCCKIRGFTGRVYRMMPGNDHYDLWHHDMVEDRLVAMSINLSSEIYSGGILQIRDKYSQRIVHEVANIGCGDAIVFRLARSLEHRITNVEGAVPKTAFAGWFRSETDFLSLLKKEPVELR